MIRKICGKTFILACGFLTASCALAQTNLEVNAGLELNLSQPGARSLGMGGAFIGMADDATAAYTNPAGLSNITITELAVEGRAWDYKTKFADDGYAVFQNGQVDGSRLIDSETSTSRNGVSFGSLVYPVKNWTWSVYFHQLANYEAHVSTSGASAFNSAGEELLYRRPIEGYTELEIQSVGLALAYRVGPSFSIGISAASVRPIWNSSVRRFLSEDDHRDGYWLNEQILSVDDNEIGSTGSLGFQWRLAEHLHIGGVYRRGPDFEITTTSAYGPAAYPDDGIYDRDGATVKFPDSFGLGLAASSTSFRFLLDWVRVRYSQMTEATINAVNDRVDYAIAASRLAAEDADELHAGFEFVFSQMANPLAVRIGGYFDPDHRVSYSGPIETAADLGEAITFLPGEDQIHYSTGMGVNFRDGKFELNVAADIADRLNTLSLSFVFRPF